MENQMLNKAVFKTCPRCKEDKPATKDYFYKDKYKPDGLVSSCKECCQSKRPSPRPQKKNIDVTQECMYVRSVKSSLINSAKARAIENGRPFSIKSEDITIPNVCPVLGIPIDPSRKGNGKASDNSPTIDRIDSSKGYTVGNIHVISFRANMLKSNATRDELKKILQFLENNQ
jgi:hypothetical protein